MVSHLQEVHSGLPAALQADLVPAFARETSAWSLYSATQQCSALDVSKMCSNSPASTTHRLTGWVLGLLSACSISAGAGATAQECPAS